MCTVSVKNISVPVRRVKKEIANHAYPRLEVIHCDTHFVACRKLRSRRLFWPGNRELALTGQVGSGDGGWNLHTIYSVRSMRFGDGSRRGSCFTFDILPSLDWNGKKRLVV